MQEAVGMNRQTVESRSPSDKRKMSPGQEKAALWQKKKGQAVQRERLLALPTFSCFGASAEEILCWSKAPCFSSQTQELEGGFRGAQSKLQRDSSLSFSLSHNRCGKRRSGLAG